VLSKSSHPYYSVAPKTVSTQKAEQVVYLCMGASVGIIVLVRLVDPNAALKQGGKKLNDPGALITVGLGASVATIFLLATAQMNPKLAVDFSILVFAGAFLLYGGPFFTHLQSSVKTPGVVPPSLPPFPTTGMQSGTLPSYGGVRGYPDPSGTNPPLRIGRAN
jgi:hypothetical protein